MARGYIQEADTLDDSTRRLMFDRAGDIGGIGAESSISDWIEDMLKELRDNHDQEYDVSNAAIRQAALKEAAAKAKQWGEDGYHDRF